MRTESPKLRSVSLKFILARQYLHGKADFRNTFIMDASEVSGNSDPHSIHPRKLIVSHADNHLFHFTIFSVHFLPIPLRLGWTTRPQLLLYFTHYHICGHRSQWRSVSAHSPHSGDGGVPPSVVNHAHYESRSSIDKDLLPIVCPTATQRCAWWV